MYLYKLFTLSILSLFILLFSSCKDKTDDECADGAIIGNYFPAYPGSYWKYNDNYGNIITYNIDGDYVKFAEKCCSNFINAQAYISDNNIGYSFYGGLGTIAIIWSPIYHNEIGKSDFVGFSFSTLTKIANAGTPNITLKRESIGYKTIVIDSGNIYENTLVVKEIDTLSPQHFYLDYFAKNIGLVMRDSVNNNNGNIDTTRILWIKDYKIFN